ncbi:MAG TPA: CorA family divalent cation transporter, partial [Lysobacter sp.]|nr:CorA family divalent cation transporter [Lysobacter sp.]
MARRWISSTTCWTTKPTICASGGWRRSASRPACWTACSPTTWTRDAFETAVDRLEILILRRPRPGHLSELQALRHLASKLRRHLASQRDLFDALGRPDFDPGQSDSAERHCCAVSARYTQVMAAVEAARELVNGSFELYTSRAAEGTNQAMHTLTVVTVAMGLAATVAGVLGMNFQSSLFDTGERGFWIVAVGIAVV